MVLDMATYHVLYNPMAGGGWEEEERRRLVELMADETLIFHDITEIGDYRSFFQCMADDDRLIIAGGDGTINRFINDTASVDQKHSVYYFATGSGNDFLCDLGRVRGEAVFCIDEYLRDLPVVTVNGKDYRFINGVGFGIDGYCCEVGDRMRAEGKTKINYAKIAILGLLFHYKRPNATVTVDGVSASYRRVWLAPTMNGRYYGGGMMITPGQDRLNASRTVSVCVLHRAGKLKTLLVFPSIFKGEHLRHTEMCTILTGHDITVTFDRPTALQVDGETICGVTEYTVHAKKPAQKIAAPTEDETVGV